MKFILLIFFLVSLSNSFDIGISVSGAELEQMDSYDLLGTKARAIKVLLTGLIMSTPSLLQWKQDFGKFFPLVKNHPMTTRRKANQTARFG